VKPGRGLFIIALFFLFLGTGAFFSEPVFLIWFYAGVVLLPLIIIDALALLLLTGRPAAEREIPVSLAQDEPVRARLIIRREGRLPFPAAILLYDLYPPSMACGSETFPAPLDKGILTQG
jgi:hypothetical protein